MDTKEAVAVLEARCEYDPELTEAVCTFADHFAAKFGIVAAGALLAFESVKQVIS